MPVDQLTVKLSRKPKTSRRTMLRQLFIALNIIFRFSTAPRLAAAINHWMPVCFATSLEIRDKNCLMARRRNPLHLLPSKGKKIRIESAPVASHSDLRGGDATDTEQTNQQKPTIGVSLSLFVTYLTVMGAKCALPSTLASITSANSGLAHYSTKLTRQDVISRLLAFSTLSIAIGKLALGPVIDSIGGIKSLQIALSTLFICLGCIGFGPRTCPTLTSLAAYWIVVDFAFSSCWAASVRTIREHMEEQRWSKEIGKLAMAARMGNAISFVFFARLLQWAGDNDVTTAGLGMGEDMTQTAWRWVFRASSAMQLIPLTLLYFCKKKIPHLNDIAKGPTNSLENAKRKSTMKASLAILAKEAQTPEFWLHLLSRTIMMVLISFLLFIPTYMNQCYDLSMAASARVGSLFAVGCLTSVLTLSDKAYPSSSTAGSYKQKSWAMLCLLSISTLCLSLQYAFLRGTLKLSSLMGSFLMFLWGFALSIPFYIPASMFALKRGGKEGSATIADVFDVCGFGLLAIFNSYVAKVLNAAGGRKAAWSPVFLWMISGSAVSMISMYFAVMVESRRNESSASA